MKKKIEKLGYSNPTITTQSFDGTLTSPIIKGTDEVGADIAVDGGVEDWVITPQDCEVFGFNMISDEMDISAIPTRTTDKHSGTYAIKFNGSEDSASVIERDLEGVEEDDTMQFTFFAKATGGGEIYFVAEYQSGETWYAWNWTGAAAGTFTEVVDEEYSADQKYTPTLTTAYTEFITDEITVPSGITEITTVFYSQDSDVYLDDATYVVNELAPASISDFETWELAEFEDFNGSNLLYAYNVVQGGASTYGKMEREETIKHAGSYSVKLTPGDNGFTAPTQTHTGLSASAYDVSIAGYTPSTNTAGVAAIAIFDMNVGEEGIRHWDTETEAWVEGVEDSAIGLDDEEDEWVEKTFRVTTSVSEEICVAFLNKDGDTDDVVYLDSFELQPVTPAEEVVIFTNENDSDIANISSNDQINAVILEDSTGVATDPVLEGKFVISATVYSPETGRVVNYTDATGFYNMKGATGYLAPTAVGTPVLPTDAVNQTNTPTILNGNGLGVDVDLKEVAITTLYTVPTGYTCYYEIETDLDIDSYTNGFDGSIGANDPDWSDYNTFTSMTSLFSTGQLRWSAGGGLNAFTGLGKATSEQVIKLNITAGATATTLSGKMKVKGYLVAN